MPGDARAMSKTNEMILYPAVGWRFAVGQGNVCLFELAYARNLGEARSAIAGARSLTLPLGLTAKQCRNLAADLMDAANQIDGGKGMA
jgi:hypothetical protein